MKSKISFELHKLGWKGFEDLVGCIFRDAMGQTFQIFSDGVDGGRDGAFHGIWSPQLGEVYSGTFTIQCKHTAKPDGNFTASLLTAELPKIKKLADSGLADNYLLVTNYKLSANQAKKFEDAAVAAGAKFAKIYGADWIDSVIAERPNLRRLVPRLYGLGDLTQIITHQAYRQSREVLESLIHDLNCFVPTEAYKKCAHALKEHGFVMLIGEPASGKTTIANLMALSAADEWGLQTFMLSTPTEFTGLRNPDDPGQFFWVDDAFGSTQYEPGRVMGWNARLPKLKAAIHAGARVIFTSRDYIFNAAKRDLKISGFELFDDNRVIIEVEALTRIERQMMLYNHLKCGAQAKQFKSAVKPFLEDAARVPKFLPEIARRFSNPKFTRRIQPDSSMVCDFFANPTEWLEEVLLTLASGEKAAIALVFISGGRLPIPIPRDDKFEETISMMNSTVGEVKFALDTLNESLLSREREVDNEYWRFKHPTIRDAFAKIVGGNPELIDIYLSGVSTDKLMQEVTCGDLKIQGVKIMISQTYYPHVLARLNVFGRTGNYLDPVGNFLATRCSGNFLIRYFSEIEKLDKLPREILYFSGNALKILLRLHSESLLPELVRRAAVDRIAEISKCTYSISFLNQYLVGSLLSEVEEQALFDDLQVLVISNQDSIISEIEASWDGEDEPGSLFSDIIATVSHIVDDEDAVVSKAAEILLTKIQQTVADMEERRTLPIDYAALTTEETLVAVSFTGRSIFDDVDE